MINSIIKLRSKYHFSNGVTFPFLYGYEVSKNPNLDFEKFLDEVFTSLDSKQLCVFKCNQINEYVVCDLDSESISAYNRLKINHKDDNIKIIMIDGSFLQYQSIAHVKKHLLALYLAIVCKKKYSKINNSWNEFDYYDL